MQKDPISDILMKLQGNCPNCGTTLTFKEAAVLAKDNGIKEDAVMCHNCKKAYTVNLTLHSMTFLEEIKTENTISNDSIDYAKDFKVLFDKKDYVNSMKKLKEWQTKYPNDANSYYAGIIMAVGNENVSYDDLKVLKEVGDQSSPLNSNLLNWYKNQANTALEIVKNSEKEEVDYASEFKNFYESKQFNEAVNTHKTWINEFPDDANVYYAEIILATNNNVNDLENIKKLAEKKNPINTSLSDWYKNEANIILTNKINEKIRNDTPIHNVNNNQQVTYPNTMNNNMNNSVQTTVNEDNSLFAKIFYKKDAYTNEYRISKTKTISVYLFLFLFVTSYVFYIVSYSYSIMDYIFYLFVSLLLALIFAVPVFIVGYIISYFLDKNKKNSYEMNQQMNYNNSQNYIQQNNIPQNNIPQNKITDNKTKPENNQENKNDIQYSESDNLGTRHDTIEKANSYWLGERFHMETKPPFTLYIFENPTDAEEALLELPYIHKANDTGNLICDKVFQYGYYKVSENNYEAIICGKDLTPEEFKQAEESFKKHNGKLKNNLKPEETTIKTTNKKSTSNGVRYRETIKKDQFTYECYDADTREEAQEFLKGKPVTERLYYICVYTPEGDYGRDIDGIYQM